MYKGHTSRLEWRRDGGGGELGKGNEANEILARVVLSFSVF